MQESVTGSDIEGEHKNNNGPEELRSNNDFNEHTRGEMNTAHRQHRSPNGGALLKLL